MVCGVDGSGIDFGGDISMVTVVEFLAVVVLSVIALIIYAMRPPRVIRYSLSNKGISEGERLYNYSEFKSFGILKEGQHFAIALTPTKRFSPRLMVYFPAAQGEEIVDAFGGVCRWKK